MALTARRSKEESTLPVRPSTARLRVPPAKARAWSATSSRNPSLGSRTLSSRRPSAILTPRENDNGLDLPLDGLGVPPPSPRRASFRAAEHLKQSSSKSAPKSLLAALDRLEASVLRFASEDPIFRPELARQRSRSARKASMSQLQGQRGLSCYRTHLLSLYEMFLDETRGGAAVSSAPLRPQSARDSTVVLRPPTTFIELLRLYYPSFSKETLEAMVDDCAEHIAHLDRRHWMASAKRKHADKLRLAFLKSDTDGNGGLDVNEFVSAVREACKGRARVAPVTRSASGRLMVYEAPSVDELRALFDRADADGNGVVDFDEFVTLCSEQPWLVAAFDTILETGLRRRRKTEEARLHAIFRHPVSPISHAITSPTGARRFRPSLYDLRPTHEVGEALRSARGGRSAI
jgi:hypothetical protein